MALDFLPHVPVLPDRLHHHPDIVDLETQNGNIEGKADAC